ncbi:uncharacterized protein MONBRDRAFT_9511 [Monosiga brevicollis MX1]|uniref:N-acetyltransferase domain-containing protein n=1 Tax=Monosiga brevicollis TaxID=81824 RepID=A9V3D8_MONBE|nr:uncharacterized protein MONBRDRAFT_9511 [Monosiga brevicollis MX1]EDQ88171.1 predicted protein [Monosiga brevicollis MX1]|eukprot:XP_001747247.1 hypothetical protein [Monosiga brevicollis MX1]
MAGLVAFRTMTMADLEEVVEWAAAEGWNPGLADAPAFFAADPEGLFVATRDDKPVAAIAVVNHNDQFAFLGLYICRAEYRGQGIGFALWQHALQHAGDRCVALEGVAAQVANYAKSGFTPAYKTERFTGLVEGQSHPLVRSARPDDVDMLTALEAAGAGTTRLAFMHAWLADHPHRQTLVLERDDGTVAGFVTVRQCREASKIGPLVADNLAHAKVLLRAAAHHLGSGAVALVLDVPAPLTGLADLCRSQGMTVAFDTMRMYRGSPLPAPSAPPGAIYTPATLEVG